MRSLVTFLALLVLWFGAIASDLRDAYPTCTTDSECEAQFGPVDSE